MGEGEELHFRAEFGGQKLVEERDVVVVATDPEDLFPAQPSVRIPIGAGRHIRTVLVFQAKATIVPSLFDIPEKFDPDLVWIEPAAVHHGAATVSVRILDTLVAVHDPPFRHDVEGYAKTGYENTKNFLVEGSFFLILGLTPKRICV